MANTSTSFKLNWGHGIAMALGAFILLMLGFLVVAIRSNHTLINEQPYEDGLKYQTKIDSQAPTELVPTIAVEPHGLTIDFNTVNQPICGFITIKSPVDPKIQHKTAFKTHPNGLLEHKFNRSFEGLWWVVLEWEQQSKKYHHEQRLILGL